MGNIFKNIDLKKHTPVQQKKKDRNKTKIDEDSYKNIVIYYLAYVTIKNPINVKINSVNTLYFIRSKKNGYFEENNKNSI